MLNIYLYRDCIPLKGWKGLNKFEEKRKLSFAFDDFSQ